jgi:hypothetical protein
VRGLLIATPSNALVDIVVLVVAGVAVASALLRRLLR